MTVNDIPLISFFQRILDPVIIMGTLYLLAAISGSPFTGYSLVLMILAFFISSSVFQYVDPYRTWRSGRMLAYARDIFVGWIITVLILVFLGSATGLSFHYDSRLVMGWFLLTPFVLLASHLADDGDLVLAGILERQADDMAAAYAPYCRIEVLDRDDGWVLMSGRRQP